MKTPNNAHDRGSKKGKYEQGQKQNNSIGSVLRLLAGSNRPRPQTTIRNHDRIQQIHTPHANTHADTQKEPGALAGWKRVMVAMCPLCTTSNTTPSNPHSDVDPNGLDEFGVSGWLYTTSFCRCPPSACRTVSQLVDGVIFVSPATAGP